MKRSVFVLFVLLLCCGCASSDRMLRMSGGVLEEYSVPKSSRLRAEKYQRVSSHISSPRRSNKMVLAGMDDTLINIWPFFFRNNAYWSILWPLVDKDPYGFAFRPFYNQEGDEYSILFPLAAWNPVAKNGWVALFGWNKTGFGLVPLFWHWKENPYKGGGYYTPFFFHTYNNTPFVYTPRKEDGRIKIKQRWHRNGERTLFLFPFYYGRETNIEAEKLQFLYNISYKNKAAAKARWDYHYKGKKPFPETEWEFEKFRAEVFASLPSRQEKTYGFFPFWHGVYHENGNYANRFLLLAGNKKYKTFTGFDIMGELVADYKENCYPFPNDRYNRFNREFYSHLLLFSKFTSRENYKREGEWQKLNSLYQLKNSRRSFAQKLPSIQEELQKLDQKRKLPKEVVNDETFGLFLDEISKNYSFPTYKEYAGRVFPLFWYFKGEKRSHLILPPLLTWSWRRGKEYNFHSLPLMTFLKRSPQEDRTTLMTPLAYYAKERRRKRSHYRIFPRTQKLVNEWGCAELRDRYAVCGLFYKGRFGFNVAKEGVDAKAADALRVALHNLHYEGSRLEKNRIAILKEREKNQKWQTKNEIQRLERLLQFEKLKKREKDLAGKEKEFRKKIDSALSHAKKIRFAIQESAFRKRAESEKALAKLMNTHTELRFYEDIGSGLFFHKQSYYNGDFNWHFLHLLAGGEKKGERRSTHILHLLYRHREEGKKSEKIIFPFISSIKDGEDARVSFLYRVLSFHRKNGKTGGHILFIPFGEK